MFAGSRIRWPPAILNISDHVFDLHFNLDLAAPECAMPDRYHGQYGSTTQHAAALLHRPDDRPARTAVASARRARRRAMVASPSRLRARQPLRWRRPGAGRARRADRPVAARPRSPWFTTATPLPRKSARDGLPDVASAASVLPDLRGELQGRRRGPMQGERHVEHRRAHPVPRTAHDEAAELELYNCAPSRPRQIGDEYMPAVSLIGARAQHPCPRA